MGRCLHNGKRKNATFGSTTPLAETPTCCGTCAGLEGDSVEEASVEKSGGTATADDGGAAVEVETRRFLWAG